MELSKDLISFFQKKKEEKGRNIKVLHIGNIANNAYINAKILNRLDFIDADVLCGDYFHIMGCPEWEELDIPSDHNIDHWKPIFSKYSKQQKYTRPSWFVQGEEKYCLQYIYHKNAGNSCKSLYYKRALNIRNKLIISDNPVIRSLKFIRRIFMGVRSFKFHKKKTLRFIVLVRRWVRSIRKRCEFCAAFLHFLLYISSIIFSPIALVTRLIDKIKRDPRSVLSDDIKAIIKRYKLDRRHVLPNEYHLWKKVLKQYDVVHAYATSGIYPFVCDVPYVCYEHGTIRDLPFEDSIQGRICKMVYQNAQATFVTNIDNLESAKKLNLKSFVPIPHAFDDTKVTKFFDQIKAGEIKIEKRAGTFIAPARHHWTNNSAVWGRKGNDKIVKAAQILSKAGYSFKIIFIEFGVEVDETKKLIKTLGLEEHFEWMEPTGRRNLVKLIYECEALLDQFYYLAIGGATIDGLSIGAYVFTGMSPDTTQEFFGGKDAPIFMSQDEKSIAEFMQKIIKKEGGLPFTNKDVSNWFSQKHSSNVIATKQLEIYSKLI